MKPYLFTLFFYVLFGIIIRLLEKHLPGAHDSGLGWGALAQLLFYIGILALLIFNIYNYIQSKEVHFIIIAAIHLTMLIFSTAYLNWWVNGF